MKFVALIASTLLVALISQQPSTAFPIDEATSARPCSEGFELVNGSCVAIKSEAHPNEMESSSPLLDTATATKQEDLSRLGDCPKGMVRGDTGICKEAISHDQPTVTGEPKDGHQQLSESTEEPMKVTQEPFRAPVESVDATKESSDVAAKPSVMNKKLSGATEEQSKTTEESPVVTKKPSAVADEVAVVIKKPSTEVGEVAVTIKKPLTATEQPLEVTEEPSATTKKLSGVAKEQLEVTEQPTTVTRKPLEVFKTSAANKESSEVTEEPAVATKKPSTDAKESSEVTEEPSAASKKPSVAVAKKTSIANKESSEGTEESSGAAKESSEVTEEPPRAAKKPSGATKTDSKTTEEQPSVADEPRDGMKESVEVTSKRPRVDAETSANARRKSSEVHVPKGCPPGTKADEDGACQDVNESSTKKAPADPNVFLEKDGSCPDTFQKINGRCMYMKSKVEAKIKGNLATFSDDSSARTEPRTAHEQTSEQQLVNALPDNSCPEGTDYFSNGVCRKRLRPTNLEVLDVAKTQCADDQVYLAGRCIHKKVDVLLPTKITTVVRKPTTAARETRPSEGEHSSKSTATDDDSNKPADA